MKNSWLLIGAVSGFLSVALGAFGAHGLAKKIPADLLAIFQTGVQYQMAHALALVALGIWFHQAPGVLSVGGPKLAAWCFFLGTVFFSGSLYVLALTSVRTWGAVTPIGGVLFLMGWAALAWAAWRA